MEKEKSEEVRNRRKFLKTGARYLALGGFTLLGIGLGTGSGSDTVRPVSPSPACRDCANRIGCRKWVEPAYQKSDRGFSRCPDQIKRKSNGKK
jgi:hypothetical protein